MFLDDVVDDGEAESHVALLVVLGGGEREEDVRQQFAVDAGAAVAVDDPDVILRFILLQQYLDLAAVLKRVDTVLDEIQNHLPDLGLVGGDHYQLRLLPEGDMNILGAGVVLEQVEQTVYQLAQVEAAALHLLAVGEQEDILQDTLDMQYLVLELTHNLFLLLYRHIIEAEVVEIVGDYLQRVVYLMRHPGGEETDRGEALGENRLFAQVLLLGNILEDQDTADVVGIIDDRVDHEVYLVVVLADQHRQLVEGYLLLLFHGVGDTFGEGDVLRSQQAAEGVAFLRLDREEAAPAVVYQLDVQLLVEYQQVDRQMQEYRLVIAEQIVEIGDILVGDGVPADLVVAEFDQVTLVDGVGRIGKDDRAFTEDRDGIGEVADVIDIMGDPEYREAALLVLVQEGDDLRLIIGIKPVENLVENEQARVERELEDHTERDAFGLREVADIGVHRDIKTAVLENVLDPAAQA